MNKLLILGAILVASGTAYGGFKAGCYYQVRQSENAAVAANQAHWDMRTKAFVWGSPELVNLVNSDVTKLMEDARVPSRKPRQ